MANSALNPANRLGLDYHAEALALGSPVVPIIDAHAHINGRSASPVFAEIMDLFGIDEIWSMTTLEDIPAIRKALGGRFRPIAMPKFNSDDLIHAMGAGFIEELPRFRDEGCQLAKFWAAPRSVEIAEKAGVPGYLHIDHPSRLECMDSAVGLGMGLMFHIADPDTWFQSKYTDSKRYGTKREQYEPLEMILQRYEHTPVLVAHMGGWPENLPFLSELLSKHPNLHLDSSATKWMIRELSKHTREEIIAFLTTHGDRILFGSDQVTMDDHLKSAFDDGTRAEMANKANSTETAKDLYASRYYALRTFWETSHCGESPIADPDLAMIDPKNHTPMDAPQLVGKSLPNDLLKTLYQDAAVALTSRLEAL